MFLLSREDLQEFPASGAIVPGPSRLLVSGSSLQLRAYQGRQLYVAIWVVIEYFQGEALFPMCLGFMACSLSWRQMLFPSCCCFAHTRASLRLGPGAGFAGAAFASPGRFVSASFVSCHASRPLVRRSSSMFADYLT